jgi:hypothetical protein
VRTPTASDGDGRRYDQANFLHCSKLHEQRIPFASRQHFSFDLAAEPR